MLWGIPVMRRDYLSALVRPFGLASLFNPPLLTALTKVAYSRGRTEWTSRFMWSSL
jgi:hypothetical protein